MSPAKVGLLCAPAFHAEDRERVLEPVERERARQADDVPAVDQALAEARRLGGVSRRSGPSRCSGRGAWRSRARPPRSSCRRRDRCARPWRSPRRTRGRPKARRRSSPGRAARARPIRWLAPRWARSACRLRRSASIASRLFTITQRQYSSTFSPRWLVPVVRTQTMPFWPLAFSFLPRTSETERSVSPG